MASDAAGSTTDRSRTANTRTNEGGALWYSLPMDKSVKTSRPRGTTAISSKHQVTIPVDAMHEAGFRPGDRLRARAEGSGKVVLEREADPLDAFLGALTGVYKGFDLDALRDEWA